jgi:hypothetical protein
MGGSAYGSWRSYKQNTAYRHERINRTAYGDTLLCQHDFYLVPSGGWSSDPIYREIGLYNLAFMVESLDGFALFLLQRSWAGSGHEVKSS